MIHMPHRSVTRFFVPLIDVLLLLFCIFLLMPFANEDAMEKTQEEAISERDKAAVLKNELDRREYELVNQQVTRQQLQKEGEYERLKAENEELRKKLAMSVEQKYAFHLIDIDGDTGDLYLKGAAGKRRDIKTRDEALKMIHDDRATADKNPLTRGKRLYYCFVYPRRGPQDAYPVKAQIDEYKQWFTDAGVEVSFLKGATR